MLYLDDQEIKTQKWEIYAARIIASIRRVFSTHPERVKEEDYILKPEKGKSQAKAFKIPVGVTKEQRTKEAKSWWGSWMGIAKRKDK